MKCFTSKPFTTQAGLGREGKYSHTWSDTFLLLKKKKIPESFILAEAGF